MKPFLCLIWILICVSATAQESELSFEVAQKQLTVQTGPGNPAMQSPVASVLAQATFAGRSNWTDYLGVSGIFWTSANTLPTGVPTEIPNQKVSLDSKVLEALLRIEPIPGILALDIGKKSFRSSSGFSSAPLNLLDRGTEKSGGQAVSRWEEGWIEVSAAWFAPAVTVTNAFLPSVTWSQEADRYLKTISSKQESWSDLLKLDAHWGNTDLRILSLWNANGIDRAGMGIDTNAGDEWTIRGEGIMSSDAVLETMVGSTWSFNPQSTLMGEYSWKSNAGSKAHHGFLRFTTQWEEKTETEFWTLVNLIDGSGIFGASIHLDFDHSQAKIGLENTWGNPGSESGSLVYLWKIVGEYRLFF